MPSAGRQTAAADPSAATLPAAVTGGARFACTLLCNTSVHARAPRGGPAPRVGQCFRLLPPWPVFLSGVRGASTLWRGDPPARLAGCGSGGLRLTAGWQLCVRDYSSNTRRQTRSCLAKAAITQWEGRDRMHGSHVGRLLCGRAAGARRRGCRAGRAGGAALGWMACVQVYGKTYRIRMGGRQRHARCSHQARCRLGAAAHMLGHARPLGRGVAAAHAVEGHHAAWALLPT
ncbi:MAG: hypothetical protein J3K34DRAFT_248675 [Monoraphidium minutum]|nr:MAG: hypothetical protein J3K34DRAFT_248675 [Monoraphidium minutum]